MKITLELDSNGQPYIELIADGTYTALIEDKVLKPFIEEAKKRGVILKVDKIADIQDCKSTNGSD